MKTKTAKNVMAEEREALLSMASPVFKTEKPVWKDSAFVAPLSHISKETWEKLEAKELEAFMTGNQESPAERLIRLRSDFEKSIARENAMEQLTALENERAFLKKQIASIDGKPESPGKPRKGNYGGEGKGLLSVNGKSLRACLGEMIASGHDKASLQSFAYRTLSAERHDKKEAWLKAMARRHVDVALDVAKNGKRSDTGKGKGKAKSHKTIEITGAQIKAILEKPLAGHIELGMGIDVYAKAHAIVKEYKAQGIIA